MKNNLRTEKEIMQAWRSHIPVVSICCLAYNHENYIEDALEGFLIQETNFPFEIIIHDDASTDNTTNVIREYEKAYPHIIKPIYQKENQYSKKIKISATFIYPRVQGDFIALCEGDDFWTKSYKLQTQVDYMKQHPECIMLCHSYNKISSESKKTIEEVHFTDSKLNADEVITSDKVVQLATRLFRKKAVLNKPKFFYDLDIGDYPDLLYAISKGEIHSLSQNMSNYRVNSKGSFTQRVAHNNSKRLKNLTKLKTFILNYNNFTHNQFKEIVEKEYDILDFKIACYNHDYKSAYKRRAFHSTSIAKKIFILTGVLFPTIIDFIHIVSDKIRGIS